MARIYGVMAEFDSPTALVAATREARRQGSRKMEAYSPFPIEELNHVLDLRANRVSQIVLAGGVAGLLTGLGLQYYVAVIDYPINVGGRPLASWPAFIPVTFELTILLASLAAVIGMLALNGLPQPYHPVFNAPRFALASQNRFFLCIEAVDPLFDRDRTSAFLQSANAKGVSEVEH